MTKEQVITRIKNNSMYRDDRETADYIIKALEQQPSEDCVSRQDVGFMLMAGKLLGADSDRYIQPLLKELEDLSPVTPTGTCKDCNELLDFIGAMNECDEISNEAYAKISNHCADFERRKE